MSDKTKSVHCVREVRDATIERFRLPDDGRQWKTAARNRQALANYLATFADGDGTRVRPSEPTMTEHFGWSRATTFRYLDDLKALGLQKRVGRFGGSRGSQSENWTLLFSVSESQTRPRSRKVKQRRSRKLKRRSRKLKRRSRKLKRRSRTMRATQPSLSYRHPNRHHHRPAKSVAVFLSQRNTRP